MKTILEMLGIDKLDESKQDEIKQKLDEVVDLKVTEKVKEKENEMKETLTEEYEQKFEDYKNSITEQFSNFVDEVLEEEMAIPEKIKEFARKGELYDEVMEILKTKMAIDEGHVDDEMKELLKECKTEITSLKDQTNELISENMKLKTDAKEFAAALYVREKCEGLPLKQREKVTSLLEGVTDKEEIDRKFDVIVESTDDNGKLDEEQGKGNVNPENKLGENTNPDPFENMMRIWSGALSEGRK